jgi:hypothetical protein
MNEDTPSPLNDVITMTLIHQYKEAFKNRSCLEYALGAMRPNNMSHRVLKSANFIFLFVKSTEITRVQEGQRPPGTRTATSDQNCLRERSAAAWEERKQCEKAVSSFSLWRP